MSQRFSSLYSESLQNWYLQNQRDLPWRRNKNPYNVWISEVMLQQTTVQAVIPFYEKFLKRFPTIQHLAEAPIDDVLSHWSGLGYYSRARNIHKASKIIAESGFPQSYQQLILLPGFGPYTARAVSSISFKENVGVVDGNVIRVIARVFGRQDDWWQNKVREEYQKIADQIVHGHDAGIINQALMDLGATVCTPKKVTCMLCPWSKVCVARKQDLIETLPLSKPRKKMEIWTMQPEIHIHRDMKTQTNLYFLTTDHQLPFLKKDLFCPASSERLKQKPTDKPLVKHTITHHHIFIQSPSIQNISKSKLKSMPGHWYSETEIRSKSPSILTKKILDACKKQKLFDFEMR
jgi:A/G-specific adenine glycosylase